MGRPQSCINICTETHSIHQLQSQRFNLYVVANQLLGMILNGFLNQILGLSRIYCGFRKTTPNYNSTSFGKDCPNERCHLYLLYLFVEIAGGVMINLNTSGEHDFIPFSPAYCLHIPARKYCIFVDTMYHPPSSTSKASSIHPPSYSKSPSVSFEHLVFLKTKTLVDIVHQVGCPINFKIFCNPFKS